MNDDQLVGAMRHWASDEWQLLPDGRLRGGVSSNLENPRPVWFFSMNTAGWKLAAKVKMPVKSGSGWTPVAVSGPLAVIGGTSSGTGTTGFAYIYQS